MVSVLAKIWPKKYELLHNRVWSKHYLANALKGRLKWRNKLVLKLSLHLVKIFQFNNFFQPNVWIEIGAHLGSNLGAKFWWYSILDMRKYMRLWHFSHNRNIFITKENTNLRKRKNNMATNKIILFVKRFYYWYFLWGSIKCHHNFAPKFKPKLAPFES